MERFKTLALYLALVACAVGAWLSNLDAAGHLGPEGVLPELRTEQIEYVLQIQATNASGDGGTVTPGRRGVIATNTVNDVGVITLSRDGGTISPPPYPCRVHVKTIDDDSDQTLTCASVLLEGWNQFGSKTSETISSVTETAQLSARVYENIDRITGTTCVGGASANDLLHVSCSQVVGLPWRTSSQNGIERGSITNVCVLDQSATNESYCYRPRDVLAEGATAEYDTNDNSVNCLKLTDAGVPPLATATGDICQVRQRAAQAY